MLDYIPGVYFFACGSVVRNDGTVFIAYAAPADGDISGPSYAKVYSSDDNFETFEEYLIDYWTGGQSCPEWADCSTDFLNGGCSLAIDSDDNGGAGGGSLGSGSIKGTNEYIRNLTGDDKRDFQLLRAIDTLKTMIMYSNSQSRN